jgi:hypothetical protein
MKLPMIEISDKKRLIVLIIIFVLFVSLMVFEVIRTENYKRNIEEKCFNDHNRYCTCEKRNGGLNGLYQIDK